MKLAHNMFEHTSVLSPLLKTFLGKILATTIQENATMLKDLLDLIPQVFLPSIPHLVYQYAAYTNYPSLEFGKKNIEIPE